MTCDEFRNALPDLMLRVMTPEAGTEARAHAAACNACGSTLAAERELDALISASSTRVPINPGVEPRARRAFFPGPTPAMRWIASVAAVLVLGGAATFTVMLAPGTASAEKIVAQARALHEVVASGGGLPACCGSLDAIKQALPADVPLDLAAAQLARRGWRLADGQRTPVTQGASRLVFRKRNILLTCLMLPDQGTPLPDDHRRTVGTRECWVFTTPGLTHLVQRHAGKPMCVLTADLPEAALLDLCLSADAPTATGGPVGESRRLRVTGMLCGRCEAVVKATLEGVPGVVRAAADHAKGTAELWVPPGHPNAGQVVEAARAALQDAGFEATPGR